MQRLQEQADRPWLIPTAFKFEKPITVGEPLLANVVLTNTGRSPANGVSFTVSIVATVETEVERFGVSQTAPNDFVSIGIMAPLTTIDELARTKEAINAGQIAAVQSGKLKVFVYGIATYDIPRGRGITKFCAMYVPAGDYFTAYKTGTNYAK